MAEPSKISFLKIGSWLVSVSVIVLLSIFGRVLQSALAIYLDMMWVVFFVFTVLCGVLVFLCINKKKFPVPTLIIFLASVLLLLGGTALYFGYLAPVESFHFLVFACFGWLSQTVFGTFYAMITVCSMAIGDEVLQYFLPDRVGDVHDVIINTLSGLTGILITRKWRRLQ